MTIEFVLFGYNLFLDWTMNYYSQRLLNSQTIVQLVYH